MTNIAWIFSTETIVSYAPSYEVVPEPLTILGSITALGFGIGFKRKEAQSKPYNKKHV